MCVIIHGLKKKHVRRVEVQTAMRNNGSGFFGVALKPDGTRDMIRTLSEDDFLKFFDEKVADDDGFVMHARIPSHGPKTLDNVHGWEEDGILFSHNMTLTDLKPMMTKLKWGDKTDSEFFFRKVFMPYYRGLGPDAYKDGKFHPDLQAYVEHFCGSWNKFCFVMPDNNVIRIGPWVNEKDRLENGEIAFWASNSTYTVRGYSGYAGFDDEDDYYGVLGVGAGVGGSKMHRGRHNPQSQAKASSNFDGKLLLGSCGTLTVLKLAVIDWTMQNLVTTRIIGAAGEVRSKFEAILALSVPPHFNQEGYRIVASWLPKIVEQDGVKNLVESYAKHIEERICTEAGKFPRVLPGKWSLEDGLKKLYACIEAAKMALNIDYRFQETDPCKMVTAFEMRVSRKGNPVMERVASVDLLGIDSMKEEDVFAAFGRIIKAMREEALKELADAEKEKADKAGAIDVTAESAAIAKGDD